MVTDDQFEAMAKNVADILAGHDTAGNGYIEAGYSKPNGIIFMRLCHNREAAFKLLDTELARITFRNGFVLDPVDRDCFYDHILANLAGNGLEVDFEDFEDQRLILKNKQV